jgi:HEPN domain-containing protein
MASNKDKELQPEEDKSPRKKALCGSGGKPKKESRSPKIVPMSLEEKFEHWLERAQEDLRSAETLIRGGHFVLVAFMCQQAIEKFAKGLYILYVDDNIPYIHDINTIFNKFKDKLSAEMLQNKLDFFDDLTSYYMNNRYPDYKKRMYELTSKTKAKEILSETKDTFAWLLTLKP